MCIIHIYIYIYIYIYMYICIYMIYVFAGWICNSFFLSLLFCITLFFDFQFSCFEGKQLGAGVPIYI